MMNLAVSDTMKSSMVCRAALEMAFEVTGLIKISPQRNAAFDLIKADAEHGTGGGSVRSSARLGGQWEETQ